MVTVTVVVLAALVALIVACLLTRAVPVGIALLLTSAGWMPLNNKRLEGPLLFALSGTHGVTLSDLLGLAGFGVSSAVLAVRAKAGAPAQFHWIRPSLVIGGCVGIYAIGVLAAALWT
jgi:hypothetical protein